MDKKGKVTLGTQRFKIPNTEVERVQFWVNHGPYAREKGDLRDHITPNPAYVASTSQAHKNVTVHAQGGGHHYRRRTQIIGATLPPGPPTRTWFGVREYINQFTLFIFQSCHSNYKSTTSHTTLELQVQ